MTARANDPLAPAPLNSDPLPAAASMAESSAKPSNADPSAHEPPPGEPPDAEPSDGDPQPDEPSSAERPAGEPWSAPPVSRPPVVAGGWPSGPQRVQLWWVDVGLALVVAVVGLLPTGHTPRWAYPAAFLGGLTLVARRRWPRLVLLATFPAVIGGLGTVAAGAALYAVGRSRPSLRGLWLPLTLTVILTLAPIVYNDTRYGLGPAAWGDWVVTVLAVLLITGGPAAGGALAATRMQLIASLAALRATEADRDAAVAAKVRAEERNRLAREVHDIVGHYAALIAVQAGALESRTADPQTRDTAARLRELSSDALEEMRTAVAMWGRAGVEPIVHKDWVPWVLQPAIGARESGVALTVHHAPDLPRHLREAVIRLLRRAVQEGVTNAVRHCPGVPVEVRLEPAGGPAGSGVAAGSGSLADSGDPTGSGAPGSGVRMVIRNPVPALAKATARGGGNGLAGLRDRVARLGGTVDAGLAEDGCWELTVTCG